MYFKKIYFILSILFGLLLIIYFINLSINDEYTYEISLYNLDKNELWEENSIIPIKEIVNKITQLAKNAKKDSRKILKIQTPRLTYQAGS